MCIYIKPSANLLFYRELSKVVELVSIWGVKTCRKVAIYKWVQVDGVGSFCELGFSKHTTQRLRT